MSRRGAVVLVMLAVLGCRDGSVTDLDAPLKSVAREPSRAVVDDTMAWNGYGFDVSFAVSRFGADGKQTAVSGNRIAYHVERRMVDGVWRTSVVMKQGGDGAAFGGKRLNGRFLAEGSSLAGPRFYAETGDEVFPPRNLPQHAAVPARNAPVPPAGSSPTRREAGRAAIQSLVATAAQAGARRSLLRSRYGDPMFTGNGREVYAASRNGVRETIEVDDHLYAPISITEVRGDTTIFRSEMEYQWRGDGSAVLVTKRGSRSAGTKGVVVVEQSFSNLYLAR